jgi:fructose-1,6-bisphosphatase I
LDIGTTLTRFLIDQQRRSPGATGTFTTLLEEIATAAKLVAREVNKAGLAEHMGLTGRTNVHGEQVQALDDFANWTVIRALDHTGLLAAMASEEMEDVFPIPEHHPRGPYVLVFDPVDGSSNIDVNVSIGTIFSIYRCADPEDPQLADFLRPGREQLCAGYIIYGSSTMLVYTTGNGVHGFTLDPTIGEFLLSHEDMQIPERATIFSVNEAYAPSWDPRVRGYVDGLKGSGRSGRYIGSLVADFHRNLLKGGIFLYPAETKSPQGKLRLVYEANPLAFIVEQAGGSASSGDGPILDLDPRTLHQRVPLIIGSRDDVADFEAALRSPAAEPQS